MSEHSIVQTDENLDYTMTETRNVHRSLTFSLGENILFESSVQFELLQEGAEVITVITVQQDVQQGKIFQLTLFYVRNLHFEEGSKCFQLNKMFGFVNEQQFALQADWNEGAMYQKLCHVAMKHDKPVEGNGKGETQDMNAPFGKKTDFDFEVNLVEETIPSQRNV